MKSRMERPRHKKRLKKRIIPLFLLIVFVVYLGWALVASPKILLTPKLTKFQPQIVATVAVVPDWPTSGQAALGTLEGGVSSTYGTQAAVPIASIAKVMLALSVLREKPIDANSQGETLTLTQADVDLYNHYLGVDGSVALVAANEQITEYQALQALLLPSANNFADTLANWAFGSVANYDAYANNYAGQLGLMQTHFADASGYDPATVSSASDLIKLGQLAMKNSVVADIVSQTSATIPVAGVIKNVNWLLTADHEVVGIKTGNTDQAGGCMLFAVKHAVGSETITIIGAVLGAQNLQTALNQSKTLLNSAKNIYIGDTVVNAKQVAATYTTPWGSTVRATTTGALSVIVWATTPSSTPQVVATPVRLPAKAGQDVGTVLATGIATKSVKITLDSDVPMPSLWWRVTHPQKVL